MRLVILSVILSLSKDEARHPSVILSLSKDEARHPELVEGLPVEGGLKPVTLSGYSELVELRRVCRLKKVKRIN